RKSSFAEALRYSLVRWDALARYTTDGRLDICNNAAEPAIRPLALGRKIDTLAWLPGSGPSCRSGPVEGSGRLPPVPSTGLALQAQREPAGDRGLGAHPVDRLLHLPIPSVPALHRVRRRTQQAIVQEHQRLLQVGREQRLQRLTDAAEPTHPTS